jgi:hypothetical protein
MKKFYVRWLQSGHHEGPEVHEENLETSKSLLNEFLRDLRELRGEKLLGF